MALAALCGLDLGRTPQCEAKASSDLLSSVLHLELTGQISRVPLNKKAERRALRPDSFPQDPAHSHH